MGSEHQHLVSAQKSDRRRSTLAATLSRALRFSAVCTGLESARAGRLSNRAEYAARRAGHVVTRMARMARTGLSCHLAAQRLSLDRHATWQNRRHPQRLEPSPTAIRRAIEPTDRTHRRSPHSPYRPGVVNHSAAPSRVPGTSHPPSGRRQRNELGSPRAGSRSGALRGPLG